MSVRIHYKYSFSGCISTVAVPLVHWIIIIIKIILVSIL
jgi:hypothetical protein